MSLKKPKPVVIPRIPPRKFTHATTTEDLLARLKKRNKKKKKKKK